MSDITNPTHQATHAMNKETKTMTDPIDDLNSEFQLDTIDEETLHRAAWATEMRKKVPVARIEPTSGWVTEDGLEIRAYEHVRDYPPFLVFKGLVPAQQTEVRGWPCPGCGSTETSTWSYTFSMGHGRFECTNCAAKRIFDISWPCRLRPTPVHLDGPCDCEPMDEEEFIPLARPAIPPVLLPALPDWARHFAPPVGAEDSQFPLIVVPEDTAGVAHDPMGLTTLRNRQGHRFTAVARCSVLQDIFDEVLGGDNHGGPASFDEQAVNKDALAFFSAAAGLTH